ncbi:MAG: cytochrome c [Gemmatimonadaceae bacterium]|nr:cytochrome c [Gemmatimonadaceae bacterium]
MLRSFVLVTLLAVACRSGSSAGAAGGAPAAVAARPAEVTAANIALGDSLFNNGGCMRCHGRAGIGATGGPMLNDSQWLQLKSGSYEEIVGIITSGVPAASIKDSTHKFPMGARGGRMNLTDPQIKAVAAYVYSLSHK